MKRFLAYIGAIFLISLILGIVMSFINENWKAPVAFWMGWIFCVVWNMIFKSEKK